MKVLLLEDYIPLAESLGEYLEGVGCQMDYAHTAEACIDLVAANQYDVLVLDIAMPGMNGLDACEIIRRRLHVGTPLIFLTALDTLDDKLAGFKSGCDDYLVKPFSPEELWVRIQTLNLRGPRSDIGIQTIGCLQIDHSNSTVIRENQVIHLQPAQFVTVALLAKQYPHPVSKEKLVAEIWPGIHVDENALRTHMSRLRSILDKPFETPVIRTVHGKGFRLEVE